MIDKIAIKSSGLLYAGEHNSNYLFLENFRPEENAEYLMRLRATDGQVYESAIENGKVPIVQSLIRQSGRLTAELCEKIGDDYIALSGLFIFPVFDSLQDENADIPPIYEAAKTLAERAIEAAEKAEQHKLDGKDGIIYYPEFTIDENGNLILSSEEIKTLDFRINNNNLEVIING